MARRAARLLPTLLAAAAALSLAAPGGHAQAPGIENPTSSTPVTLFMHLIDFQDFPINTQQPDDSWTQDAAYGLGTSTTSCLPDGTPGADVSTAYHTFYGFSSPSYVEYLIEEGGKPRFHPERGISYDAQLDPGAPFTLYWYLSIKGPAPRLADGPDPDQVPLPVPNVVVRATMRAGDAVSVDDRAYNTGEVIAQGQSAPATLVMDQVHPGVPNGAPPVETRALGQHGGKWLYEVAVPMSIARDVIPRATGYNVRVDVLMDNPACAQGPDAALMPNVVGIHSSPQFRPRMELATLNPIRITALHPQFVGDDLVVHVGANAVWGNYDVGEPSPYTPGLDDGLQVAIAGPSPATSLGLYRLVSETNPHYAHQNDVTVVYVWPYKADRAEPGVYTVTFTARNDQGTAQAVAVTQFELGKAGNAATECDALGCRPVPAPEGGRNEAPGAGLAALVGALLAAAAVVARRRRLRP